MSDKTDTDLEMDTTRRDFLAIASGTMGVVVLGMAGVGLITTFRPSEETAKGEVVERTLDGIEPGQ